MIKTSKAKGLHFPARMNQFPRQIRCVIPPRTLALPLSCNAKQPSNTPCQRSQCKNKTKPTNKKPYTTPRGLSLSGCLKLEVFDLCSLIILTTVLAEKPYKKILQTIKIPTKRSKKCDMSHNSPSVTRSVCPKWKYL